MTIAVYGSRHQDDYVKEILETLLKIVSSGERFVFHKKIYEYLKAQTNPDVFERIHVATLQITDDENFTADLAISIGGDGTFLRTSQWVGNKEIPIIGVNTGHLGFLAPFTIAEAADAAALFKQGGLNILNRGLIKMDTVSPVESIWPYALNEIAIFKKDSASMITVDARINRASLASYKCDGLIVSTPTGSTGYNLSVGGPIVEPGSPTRIISPVAAHSLTMRPLVVPADSLLELNVTSRSSSFRVSLDGRSLTLPCGSSIFVSEADFVIKSVCKPGQNFYATLRDKLLWGSQA